MGGRARFGRALATGKGSRPAMLRSVHRLIAGGLFLLGLLGVHASASAEPASRPLTAVVELFTSQGCSSCPPADELLAEYIARPDTLALSFAVDYWDYIGWKDTFASPKFSERQRAYAHQHGTGWSVYTPQVVINGALHAVGSKQRQIDKSIMAVQRIAPLRLPVRFEESGGAMTIKVGEDGSANGEPVAAFEENEAATVWLLAIRKSAEVYIGRGENRGRNLTYRNIVREMAPIGSWRGAPETIRLNTSVLTTDDWNACAVIVQAGKGGRILGAAWMDG